MVRVLAFCCQRVRERVCLHVVYAEAGIFMFLKLVTGQSHAI